MRVLTLVAGAQALPEALRLTEEIRTFNAEIDFRLRFLHVEIEEVHAVPAGLAGLIEERVERADVQEIPDGTALETAARLALLLVQERPSVLVIAGGGEFLDPGTAAALAYGTKLAFFGSDRGRADGALDLGTDPRAAVEGLTGVAREIR